MTLQQPSQSSETNLPEHLRAEREREAITEALENKADYPELSEVDYFVTEKGSVYTVLSDGRTQRFKNVSNKEHSPTDTIVFVPDYETLKTLATDGKTNSIIDMIGKHKDDLHSVLENYSLLMDHGLYIIDSNGKKLRTKYEIDEADRVFLAFVSDTKKPFAIPVAKKPRIGFMPFETRTTIENGERFTSRHFGHAVTKIVPKDTESN
jgi:hypothetical protein